MPQLTVITAGRLSLFTKQAALFCTMPALLTAALVIGVALLTGFLFFSKLTRSLTGNLGNRRVNPAQGRANESIVLFGFFLPFGKLTCSLSPYTAKIQAYLRFRGLKHTLENSDFVSSPNGRVGGWMGGIEPTPCLSLASFACFSTANLHLRYNSTDLGSVTFLAKYAALLGQVPYLKHGTQTITDSRCRTV